MAQQRVLEIQQPDARGTFALRQPKQIFGVIVAQDHDLGGVIQRSDEGAESLRKSGATQI